MDYEGLLERYVFFDQSLDIDKLLQALNLEGNYAVEATDTFLDRQVVLHFFSPSKQELFEKLDHFSLPWLQTLYAHFELDVSVVNFLGSVSVAVLERPSIGTFEDFIKTFPPKEMLFGVIRSLLKGVVALEYREFPLKVLSPTSILVTNIEGSECLVPKISLETLWDYSKTISPEATSGGRLRSNIAPELLSNTPYVVQKPISWSVGALLFELFTGEHPLKNPKKVEFHATFTQLLERIPKPFNNAVERMLQLNPQQRWDCRQALQELNPAT